MKLHRGDGTYQEQNTQSHSLYFLPILESYNVPFALPSIPQLHHRRSPASLPKQKGDLPLSLLVTEMLVWGVSLPGDKASWMLNSLRRVYVPQG